METQQSLNSQNNLKKTEQSWRYHATWFPTILHSYSNQKQYGTGKKKHLDQWNRIEHPEINSYSHDRGGKNKQ